MANSISSYVQSKYTKTTQALLQERLLAMEIANTSLISNMPNGNTLNFPRPQYSPVAQYVKYTNVADSDVVATNEQLVINDTPYISFVWDKVDEEDAAWDVVGVQTRNIAFRLQRYIDGKVFNAPIGVATATVYNASSAPWQFTATGGTDLPDTAFGTAWATLGQGAADTMNLVTLVDPFTVQSIASRAISSRFTLGDEEFKNGDLRAKRGFSGSFLHTQLYWTPNLTTVGTFLLPQIPTANDFISIKSSGITTTFKFVAAIGTTAGNVLIEASAALSAQNLVNALNQVSYDATARATAAAVAGTKFVVGSAQDQANLGGILATLATTTITITSIFGQPVLAKSMTNAANKYGQFYTNNLMMERGSIELVLRDNVYMKTESVQAQFSTRYMFMSRFGVKQFSQGAERTVIVPVESRKAE